ncbi:hypothetical protein DL765_011062 [Monosporascus sp. GIB2]|nr:hypothetical protein DL765_011062 [Monosporascus sp. GIB2]
MDKDPAREPTVVPPELRPIGAEYPAKGAILTTVGRLLYTTNLVEGGTGDSSCTATLVRADNKATVIAAAHCVHGGAEPFFYTGYSDNLLFIPGYRDGDAPHGNYTVNNIVISRAYAEDPSFEVTLTQDRAYLVLNPDARGRPAAETLGEGQRIPFGAEPAGPRHRLGYPRYVSSGNETLPQRGQPAFRGERLAACYGDAGPWPRGPEMTGLECVMGGGSSGGPAMQNFDEEAGVGDVVAVNNINDYWNQEERRDGVFGASVTDPASEALYLAAQAIKPPPLA